MVNHPKIAVVILAAGESSRMQRPKQLLPWGDSTLLGNAINMAKDCNSEKVYVVVGAYAEEIQSRFQTADVAWILNSEWEKGMGSSIASAINHILNTKVAYEGVLTLLCDQPLITAAYLNAMISAFMTNDKGIIATAYKHSKGVPVLFHKSYFGELAGLKGNCGAKKMISNNLEDVEALLPKGMEEDLDTPEEYQQALKSHI